MLTGTPDADLPGLEVHTDAIHYRAGRDVTVGYQVVLEQDAVRQEEYLLATTADVTGEVATLDSEQFGFRVWRHPHDPVLASAPRRSPRTPWRVGWPRPGWRPVRWR